MQPNLTNVHMQVMWNRLISVVEEQALTLLRTAFSTSVREAGDLSAGVFDEDGKMIAQAVTGTPGHVNAMAEAVGNFIEDIGAENIFEGDSYITNDPWKGTGHLHDFTFVISFRYEPAGRIFKCSSVARKLLLKMKSRSSLRSSRLNSSIISIKRLCPVSLQEDRE